MAAPSTISMCSEEIHELLFHPLSASPIGARKGEAEWLNWLVKKNHKAYLFFFSLYFFPTFHYTRIFGATLSLFTTIVYCFHSLYRNHVHAKPIAENYEATQDSRGAPNWTKFICMHASPCKQTVYARTRGL